ncbi:MAG: metal-dependent transcriptional regulator [Deltaproteobacteria bacterium]|nr:metal-dependent transcriptional regulator [Deltaproteobacteria bacterium]
MTQDNNDPSLTSALEDYLETIYQFTQKQGFVRVKDIARARNVKAGSVSPAMKRLSELNLIDYAQREYIRLTPHGEELARRILSRHDVLTRFFHEILKMDLEEAAKDACAMEHSLSRKTMDNLVKLLEFLTICPHAQLSYWEKFMNCRVVNIESEQCSTCDESCIFCTASRGNEKTRTLLDMKPGEISAIVKIDGNDETRLRLLESGLLPETTVKVDHFLSNNNDIHIKVNEYDFIIPKTDASRVIIK